MVTKDNYWLLGYMDSYSMFYFTIITNNSVKGLNILRIIKSEILLATVIKITYSSRLKRLKISFHLVAFILRNRISCNLRALRLHGKLS